MTAQVSQIAMARQLNIGRVHLSNIENGRKQLPVEKLELVSLILKIDLQELKKQFYSDLFAAEILHSHCPETVLDETRKKLNRINKDYR